MDAFLVFRAFCKLCSKDIPIERLGSCLYLDVDAKFRRSQVCPNAIPDPVPRHRQFRPSRFHARLYVLHCDGSIFPRVGYFHASLQKFYLPCACNECTETMGASV